MPAASVTATTYKAQLAAWLAHVNGGRPCAATGIIPAMRLTEEQPYLRRPSFGSDGFGLTVTAVVRRDGQVHLGGFPYSAPAACIGRTITVKCLVRRWYFTTGTRRGGMPAGLASRAAHMVWDVRRHLDEPVRQLTSKPV